MAHISATIFPESLLFRTRLEVIIPQGPKLEEPADKVLYLFHGLSDDCSAWCRNTLIEPLARERGYIVIMPEVQRSFYSDMKYGSQYFTYVSEELPRICEQLFNIKHKRESTFVAGLSMGGYGAIKCGLSRPDFYSACAGFSGALDPEMRIKISNEEDPDRYREVYAIMDKGEPWPESADLFKLADKMAKLPQKTRVLVTCGDEDFLIEENRKFNEHMLLLPQIEYKYKEWPGVHDWKFWQECLPLAFDFFEKV